MSSQTFDAVARAAESGGPAEAFRAVQNALREEKDYHRLFDAMLMQARHELGMQPVALTPASEAPAEVRTAYEDRVVAAGREVGEAFLKEGDLSSAYQYFRMIGELEPVRAAVEKWKPTEDEEALEQIIEIAVSQGVHPRRGLELMLERFGICQCITTCEQLLNQGLRPPARDESIKLLVRSLHSELLERIQAAVADKEGKAPPGGSLSLLLKGRDWLFDEDAYYVDSSHLNAIVRFARLLPKCEETFLALQLCEYGCKLSSRYKYPEGTPFEDVFADSAIYLRTVAGMEVDKGLAHFRTKADGVSAESADTCPAEVYIHLATIAGRTDEAVSYAGRRLNRADFRPAFGLGVNELCQKYGRFETMTQLARRREDLLGFVAGLVQSKGAAANGK